MEGLDREYWVPEHVRAWLRGLGFTLPLEELAGANFDRQKTLRRMADEGVLLPGSGRGFTRQKRFGDSRVYCVCVDNAALEAMLERSAGAPPSVAPSQGGGPC